jgi:hypothetical protein
MSLYVFNTNHLDSLPHLQSSILRFDMSFCSALVKLCETPGLTPIIRICWHHRTSSALCMPETPSPGTEFYFNPLIETLLPPHWILRLFGSERARLILRSDQRIRAAGKRGLARAATLRLPTYRLDTMQVARFRKEVMKRKLTTTQSQ